MQKNWRKRFFPNPLQTWLVLVGILWAIAALLARIQGYPATAFIVMAVVCFGASWFIAREVRKPSEQNRVQG